jgi:hypothetical protein
VNRPLKLQELLILLTLATLFWHCSDNVAGGTGTDTGPVIEGTVTDAAGNRIADADVFLLSHDFNPYKPKTLPKKSALRRELTDGQGRYRFDSVSAGRYNIEAAFDEDKALVQDVVIPEYMESGDVEAAGAALRPAGVINVSLNALPAEEEGYLYIPGTRNFQEIDAEALSGGLVRLDGVPAATFSDIRIVENDGVSELNIIETAVELRSADTIFLGIFPDTIITGRILTESGEPAPSVVVRLIPESFNPLEGNPVPDSLMNFTDAGGYYSFVGIDLGRYSVEAVDIYSNNTALIRNVEASEDTTVVPAAVLKPPGTLSIYIPDSIAVEGAYIYIPGTAIYRQISTSSMDQRIIVMHYVPAGGHPSVNFVEGRDRAKAVAFVNDITVPSGAALVIGAYHTWERSKTISVNTTASGAGIGEDLHDFPLLVRLTDRDIDFSVNDPNGCDFRFAKTNGVPLPYEIERWDTAAAAAEIWVLLDTIYANNADQSFVMHWWRGGVGDASRSSDVFDAENGFTGVWHLGEEGNTETDGYKDATGNGFHGTGGGGHDPADVPGMIGLAREFDSSSIALPPMGNMGSEFTLQAWVNMERMEEWGFIWGSDIWNADGQVHWEFYYDTFRTAIYGAWPRDNDLTAGFVTDRWYHLTTVYSGAEMNVRFYVDGDLLLTRDYSSVVDVQLDGSSTIGRHDVPNRNFIGRIDEFSISRVARSESWVKLSCESQRRGSTVVTVE